MEQRGKKDARQIENNNKMADAKLILLVITLNINGLSIQSKGQN